MVLPHLPLQSTSFLGDMRLTLHPPSIISARRHAFLRPPVRAAPSILVLPSHRKLRVAHVHPDARLSFSPTKRHKHRAVLPGVNSTTPSPQAAQTRNGRSRRLRCDCGKLAVTVRLVRVGCDPQYTVRLPLCTSCLQLELELEADLE